MSSDSPRDAVRWWSTRLNALFGAVSDPVTFRTADGVYDGTSHFQAALTIEQLFRRVHSALMSHRDTHARRVLMFSTMDTLTSLTGHDATLLFTLSHARGVLKRLEASMSSPAQEILLPNARAAVDALEGAQSGFHLVSDENRVSLGDRSLSLEVATAKYLTVLRNATHGHGSNRASGREDGQRLLASHTGVLPHQLGLLGFLYLLDYLVQIDGVYMRALQRFATR